MWPIHLRINFLSRYQGIIQKKSVSGSQTLPLVIFDKKALFSQNSVILQYFQEKLSQKCPFLKILDAALKFKITLCILFPEMHVIARAHAGRHAGKFTCAIYRMREVIVFSILFCCYYIFLASRNF